MKKKGKHGRLASADAAPANSGSQDATTPIDRWQSILLAAFVALLVARILVPEDTGGQNGYGAPFNVLWLVLACAWLLGRLRRGNLALSFGLPDALMLALVAWHTASALVAFYAGSPRPAINMLWEWIGLGAAFFLARQIIGTVREARAVIVVMIGLACGLSAMTVHQYLVTIPNDVISYEAAKDSTEKLYEQTGQWMPPGTGIRQQFENRLRSRLPGATFALSNSLAGYLAPWFVILLAITISSRRPAMLTIGSANLLLIAVCIYLTGSRSAGLAVLFGSLLVVADSTQSLKLARNLRRGSAIALLAVAIAGLAVAVGTSVGRDALSAAVRSLTFRFDYWRATLAMIRDFPLFGCGPGQFQDYYAAYKLPQASEVVQDPHNWLLDVWATAGTPAAILLLALLTAVISRTLRAGGGAATDSEAPIETAPDTAVFGGAAGVALGTAIAWLSGFPLARMHMLLIVAGIVGAWWIWRDWSAHGVLPKRLPLIAVIALLVNLLAAGGIGFPSVAVSLWLLVAIQLNVTEGFAEQSSVDEARKSSIDRWLQSRVIRWCACTALAAMLAAAIWTDYLPVMACRLQFSIADNALAASRADQMRSALEGATAADPWSSEAATRLAAQRFADYQSLPTPTQQNSLLEADAVARRLAPHRSSVWAQSAEFAAAIHEHSASVEDLETAQGYYERAVALFPSNAELRAKAAAFLKSVGKLDLARDSAAEAIRFDDLMHDGGHTDRYLAPTVREQMEAIAHKTSEPGA
jgi:hypothetical protein